MKANVFILLSIVLLSSCQTFKSVSTSYKTVGIQNHNIYQYPVVADLEVSSKKITGTAKSLYPKQPLEDIKRAAIADALKKANADVLVEPIFEVTQEKLNVTIIVTGYYGVYKNFRKITEDDLHLIKENIVTPVR